MRLKDDLRNASLKKYLKFYFIFDNFDGKLQGALPISLCFARWYTNPSRVECPPIAAKL